MTDVSLYRRSARLGIIFGALQRVEKLQEFIAGSKPSGFGVQWRRFGKCRLLQSEMGVQIDLSGFDGLMPQPERNHRSIDTGLQQFHGGAVPQHVRRYSFVLQRRTTLLSDDDI